jgi:hypothetical protein
LSEQEEEQEIRSSNEEPNKECILEALAARKEEYISDKKVEECSSDQQGECSS